MIEFKTTTSKNTDKPKYAISYLIKTTLENFSGNKLLIHFQKNGLEKHYEYSFHVEEHNKNLVTSSQSHLQYSNKHILNNEELYYATQHDNIDFLININKNLSYELIMEIIDGEKNCGLYLIEFNRIVGLYENDGRCKSNYILSSYDDFDLEKFKLLSNKQDSLNTYIGLQTNMRVNKTL